MADVPEEARKRGLAVLADEIKSAQANAVASKGRFVEGERQPIDDFIDTNEAGGLRERGKERGKKKKNRMSRLYDNPRSQTDDD